MKISRRLLIIMTVVCIPLTLIIGRLHAAQPAPAHHGDGEFIDPFEHPDERRILRALWSWLFSDEWPEYDPTRDHVPSTQPQLAQGDSDNATVTWIGHSTVLIQHQGINVLTDPMFSERASPFSFVGPKRVSPAALTLDDLPPIHAVVISHDHYDHLDASSIRSLGNAPVYFVPLGLKAWFTNKGVDPARVIEMDWWDEYVLEVADKQLLITATPSQHFSGRGLTDRNETLWAAWGITWPDFRVWFAGDTGYNDVQFRQIGERLGIIDLGIIPIGAYEPRDMMGAVHVNPAEALQIHRDVDAKVSMAIHWGTFVLSAEGVVTPLQALDKARAQAKITEKEFAIFAVGETRHYPARATPEG